MWEITRSLTLTLLPPTATISSYFCRPNLHFPPNYTKPSTTFRCLPSAVKVANFVPTSCVALRPKCSPVRASGQPQQMGGSGSRGTNGLSLVQPILRFAGNNLLPLALVSAVGLGLAYPSLGCAADKYNLSKLGPFGIFIISGLMLRSEEISAAVEAFPVGLFGIVSILFLTPYFSRIILQIQLQPQEFITGLAMFNCMPTTLSSGVALTQLAGGNSALALAMTVISNMLGIFIVPLSLKKFVADGVGMTLPTQQLFKSLVLTILIPLLLGKVLRESFKDVADFVDRNRKLFSGISALFLSLVPWTQVSKSKSLLLTVKPTVFLVAIGLGTLLHLTLLIFNIVAVSALSAISGGRKSTFSRKENASALILVASQKTLPVMVAVIQPLGNAFGEPGLLVLPCVAAHLNQIILDSFLVNFLRPKRPLQ
ncbi:probable sodium/metabolite cotransporter BASS4, chloroplastic isoform X2 [Arachis stenosperma]|uniref:probable sodium/metabolite cotransporter BASS4, chloroplastic isoform X2 n=1 Tax=Arachis stenosperma TaxID=217475 RepID=UPI0025AD564B|nr:probable sodium/metabolite cotransporter BASS4, chloroplastic isoform X2 [Arachis stenosperma]